MSRVLDLATRAWPREYRLAHHDELVDTALAMNGGRVSLRQALSLATAGSQARFRRATAGSRRALWARGLQLGLFVWLTFAATHIAVAMLAGPTGRVTGEWWWAVAIVGSAAAAATLLLLALRHPLIATAFAAVAGTLAMVGSDAPRTLVFLLVATHVAAVWIVTSLRPPSDWRIVANMCALTTLSVLASALFGNFWVTSAGVLLALTIGSLLMAAFDPRPLAGLCCFWALNFATMTAASLGNGGALDPTVAVPLVLIGVTATVSQRAGRPRPA